MTDGRTVYISAPISGHDYNERRRFFRYIAKRLFTYGFTPVNPMDNNVAVDADIRKHMREDFKLLLGCDMILMCEGWENSVGCQKEASLSLWSGIPMLSPKEIGL